MAGHTAHTTVTPAPGTAGNEHQQTKSRARSQANGGARPCRARVKSLLMSLERLGMENVSVLECPREGGLTLSSAREAGFARTSAKKRWTDHFHLQSRGHSNKD